MKEHENGRILQSTMEEKLCLNLYCSHASYAEMPNCFDVVLGVTGTLKGLSQRETDILKIHYSIKEMTYMPSVYGNNKLRFGGDNSRGKCADLLVIEGFKASMHLSDFLISYNFNIMTRCDSC